MTVVIQELLQVRSSLEEGRGEAFSSKQLPNRFELSELGPEGQNHLGGFDFPCGSGPGAGRDLRGRICTWKSVLKLVLN